MVPRTVVPLLLLLGAVHAAHAAPPRDESWEDEGAHATAPTPDAVEQRRDDAMLRPGVPPGVDNPAINDMAPGSAMYADFTYATNSDLSTLPWVQGSGDNYRVGVGGRWQLGGLRLDAELSFQRTDLTILGMMGNQPLPQDRQKSSLALGDTTLGASYVAHVIDTGLLVDLGLGLRVRLPTHTTQFEFSAVGGGQISFGFPYYVHLAPLVLLSARKGPVGVVINEGVLSMLAKDTSIGGVYTVLPNVYFWESHAALWFEPVHWLELSTELLNCVQLNHVGAANFEPLNGVEAVYLLPAATVRVDEWWISAAGRIGIGRGARDFGVITFSGTNSFMVRLGRSL